MELGLDMRLPGQARLPETPTGVGYTDATGALGNKFTGNLDWQRSEYQRLQNNAFNAQQAAIGREFEASEAQKARDWSERMSNSAYQRAAADMKAAGINPAAMLSGAQSAGTPTASTAHGVAARSGGSGSFRSGSGFDSIARLAGMLISSGINSALGYSRIEAQKEIAKANRDLSEDLNALRLEEYEANRRQRAKFYTHGRGNHWQRFM